MIFFQTIYYYFDFRCVTMAGACLTLPFLPASNLLFTVGFVIAERVLYLPSAGLCMLVVVGMRQLSAMKIARKVHLFISCSLFFY